MDLNKAELQAIDALRAHGLIERGWTFRFDNAPSRFGCCRWGTKEITLSRKLVALNDEDEVRNTILHEVAHALAGRGAGHGPEWKRICRQIGGDGLRHYSAARVNTPPRRAVINLDNILRDIEED